MSLNNSYYPSENQNYRPQKKTSFNCDTNSSAISGTSGKQYHSIVNYQHMLEIYENHFKDRYVEKQLLPNVPKLQLKYPQRRINTFFIRQKLSFRTNKSPKQLKEYSLPVIPCKEQKDVPIDHQRNSLQPQQCNQLFKFKEPHQARVTQTPFRKIQNKEISTSTFGMQDGQTQTYSQTAKSQIVSDNFGQTYQVSFFENLQPIFLPGDTINDNLIRALDCMKLNPSIDKIKKQSELHDDRFHIWAKRACHKHPEFIQKKQLNVSKQLQMIKR